MRLKYVIHGKVHDQQENPMAGMNTLNQIDGWSVTVTARRRVKISF